MSTESRGGLDEHTRMLAQTVLGSLDHLKRSQAPQYEATQGSVRVNVEMRGMIAGISREILMSNAEIANQVIAQLEEAAAASSIEKAIAEEVARQMSALRHDITRLVRAQIEKMTENAIAERLGKGPAMIAKRVTDKMWADAFPQMSQRSNIHGRTSRPRTKRKAAK